MTVLLTEGGRLWAEAHAAASIVASVALHGPEGGWPDEHVDTARAVANENAEPDPRDGWPVHQPECHDAPIPGRNWFAGCEPGGDYDAELGTYDGTGPRVRPDGTCEGCGGRACPDCGREACPDHPQPSPS